MGWRSAGAAFNAGTYDGPLTSDQGGFASGFAKAFVPAITDAADTYLKIKREQRDEERDRKAKDLEFERQKELIVLRETLANQRAGSTRSRDADKDAIKLSREAQAIASEFGVPVDFALQTLIGNDGDGSQTRKSLEDQIGSGIQLPTASGAIPKPASPARPALPLDMGTEAPEEAPEDTGLSFGEKVSSNEAETDDLEATGEYQVASLGGTMSDFDNPLITEKQDTEEGVQVADLSGQLGIRRPDTPLSFSGVSAAPAAEAPKADPQAAYRESIQRAKIAEMSTDRIQSLLASSPDGAYKNLLESAYRGRIADDIANKSDEELAALSRAGDPIMSEVAKGILDAKVSYRNADASKILSGLDTVGKTFERRLVVANDPYFNNNEDLRTELLTKIDEHAESLRKEDARKAATQRAEPRLFGVLDDNGLIVNTVRLTETPQGLVDGRGQVVDANRFMPISEDDIDGYLKANNETKLNVMKDMAAIANGVRDLTDLAGIIQNNPRVTNRFNIAASDLVTFIGQAESFIKDLGIGVDERVPLDEAIRRLDAVQGMGADKKRVAILSLQAAYAIAALNGSAGQALSDKELEANLRNIYSTGKAEDVLSGIYLNIRRLTESGETKRQAQTLGMFGAGVGDAREVFKNAAWNMPISDFVQSQLGDPARQEIYTNALQGKIPTATRTEPTPPAIPQNAVDFLKQNAGNPEIIKAFEEKYGVPASTYLGGSN